MMAWVRLKPKQFPYTATGIVQRIVFQLLCTRNTKIISSNAIIFKYRSPESMAYYFVLDEYSFWGDGFGRGLLVMSCLKGRLSARRLKMRLYNFSAGISELLFFSTGGFKPFRALLCVEDYSIHGIKQEVSYSNAPNSVEHFEDPRGSVFDNSLPNAALKQGILGG